MKSALIVYSRSMRNQIVVAALTVSSFLVTSATPARAQVVVQAPVYAPGYATPVYGQPQPIYVSASPGPRVIRGWQEGEPIPPGYHPAERVRLGLVVGGATLFGVMYLFSALAAGVCSSAQEGTTTSICGGSTTKEDPLLLPAIGPFIQMAEGGNAVGDVFLAIDGLAQLGGIAMLIYGLAVPKPVLVRNDLGKASPPRLEISPMVGAGRAGLLARF